MQNVEAIDFTSATRGRIRPPFMMMAVRTSGTPWPFASMAQNAIIGPAMRAPRTGMGTIQNRPRGARS